MLDLIWAVSEVLIWLGFGPVLICVFLEEFSSRARLNLGGFGDFDFWVGFGPVLLCVVLGVQLSCAT